MNRLTLFIFSICIITAGQNTTSADWKDTYIVTLKPVHNLSSDFKVDWYKPGEAAMFSKEPGNIKSLPEFGYDTQRYIALYLGDTNDNQFTGVIDFDSRDKNTYPAFDLYLDRDRDGDLAEDFIVDKANVKLEVPYEGAPPQEYHIRIYSVRNDGNVRIIYQCLTVRYGFINKDDTQIPLLIMEDTPNGVFNNSDDFILMDWDLDGKLDGSHQTKGYLPLFSDLNLPGATFTVTSLDPAGQELTLQKLK